jgi:hypothetical protein
MSETEQVKHASTRFVQACAGQGIGEKQVELNNEKAKLPI